MSYKLREAEFLCIQILDEDTFFELILRPRESSVSSENDKDGLVEFYSIDYDSKLLWTELIIYASFLLKTYESFFSKDASAEYNNKTALFILPRLFENNKKAGASTYLSSDQYWPSNQLPDVCGSCFYSFGLTTSGRYRMGCYKCEGKETRMALGRLLAMQRLCPRHMVNEAILSQLIYKYYSSNGDPTWNLLKTFPNL